MSTEWVFLDKDGAKAQLTLPDPTPQLGNGKTHGGKGYEVKLVVTDRIEGRDDLIVALEH
jgi:hypothetical protein